MLLCKVCGIRIATEKKCPLPKHNASAKHLRMSRREEIGDKTTAQIFNADTQKQKKSRLLIFRVFF